MTSFLLMRHGEPDYSGPNKWHAPGWGADLAPLTSAGEQQVAQQLGAILEFGPEMVIVSPTSRALHTALVLRQELPVPFKVEFDLHEWVPDRAFQWQTLADVRKLGAEYERCSGEWPPGETRPWESVSSVRFRALAVFRRYLTYHRVLAISHAMLIEAVAGVNSVNLAGLVPLNLDDG